MKRFIRRAGIVAQIVGAASVLGLGSPANAVPPLSSEPAFNGRVMRLDNAAAPEARAHLMVTAQTS